MPTTFSFTSATSAHTCQYCSHSHWNGGFLKKRAAIAAAQKHANECNVPMVVRPDTGNGKAVTVEPDAAAVANEIVKLRKVLASVENEIAARAGLTRADEKLERQRAHCLERLGRYGA